MRSFGFADGTFGDSVVEGMVFPEAGLGEGVSVRVGRSAGFSVAGFSFFSFKRSFALLRFPPIWAERPKDKRVRRAKRLVFLKIGDIKKCLNR